MAYYTANALLQLSSILNVLIFFLSSRNKILIRLKQMKRKMIFKKKMETGAATTHYMKMVQSTDVQSAEEQNWMIRIWNFGIVQNVTAIMNIARIICSHIHM